MGDTRPVSVTVLPKGDRLIEAGDSKLLLSSKEFEHLKTLLTRPPADPEAAMAISTKPGPPLPPAGAAVYVPLTPALAANR